MERIAWSLIRSRLKSELATELRICLEALWALPGPETPFDVVLLPSNVFVGADGTAELRVPHSADQRYFRRYLAPELALGKPATVASAIYSVGALLFEAISGSPFEASASVEREAGYLAARAEATGLSRDLTDTQLLEVVLKATRARPEERWATAESFSRELDRVARHRTATREDLVWLVKRWLRRSSRAGVRSGLDPTEWSRAGVLPLPFVPFEAEATGRNAKARAASRVDMLGRLRSTTLRGFSLDLTSYPPPRPLLELAAPALATRRFVPASLYDVPSVDAESAFASDAAQTTCPPSGVHVTGSASGLPGDRRSAALITALVVAIPLVGITLWNWRASPQAASRSAPPVAQQVQAASPEPSAQGTLQPRNHESDAGAEPRASASVAIPVPVIDLTEEVPKAEPKPAKREPRLKQRGPNDYGI